MMHRKLATQNKTLKYGNLAMIHTTKGLDVLPLVELGIPSKLAPSPWNSAIFKR